MMSDTHTCTIIIPTYNERENIELLTEKVFTVLPNARILFVDDNSPDGTGMLLDSLSTKYLNQIHVLHRPNKQGLGAAYIAGYTYAMEKLPDTEFYIQMDADLSHDPSYLSSLIAMAENYDIVVSSRYTNGVSIVNWPLHRLIISKVGSLYARLVTGLPITDCTSGYKCFKSRVIHSLCMENIRSNGYVFQVETIFRAWRMGFSISEFPIIFYERTHGKSKLSISISLEAFLIVSYLGISRLINHKLPS